MSWVNACNLVLCEQWANAGWCLEGKYAHSSTVIISWLLEIWGDFYSYPPIFSGFQIYYNQQVLFSKAENPIVFHRLKPSMKYSFCCVWLFKNMVELEVISRLGTKVFWVGSSLSGFRPRGEGKGGDCGASCLSAQAWDLQTIGRSLSLNTPKAV